MTKNTEITVDVMEAAVEAWNATFDTGCGDEVNVIARAIVAERERCARICDIHPNAHHTAIRDEIMLGK
jgi:hypothetical protein